ncbi:hypothetical protein, partial [Klebsiella pneumoniae]|uniref:hypothetical protein n=1 Tax=Klebsiella pneumoniae TaxID=573 RepID=UPI00272F7683
TLQSLMPIPLCITLLEKSIEALTNQGNKEFGNEHEVVQTYGPMSEDEYRQRPWIDCSLGTNDCAGEERVCCHFVAIWAED